MAYLFSIVELAAESGEAARFFANDRPQDAYDMMFLEEAKDFFSKIIQDQRVRVSIHAYEYCPGAGIPAGDLEYLSRNFEKLERAERLRDLGEQNITMNWTHLFDDDITWMFKEYEHGNEL